MAPKAQDKKDDKKDKKDKDAKGSKDAKDTVGHQCGHGTRTPSYISYIYNWGVVRKERLRVARGIHSSPKREPTGVSKV